MTDIFPNESCVKVLGDSIARGKDSRERQMLTRNASEEELHRRGR
jgi:hypothetical protein